MVLTNCSDRVREKQLVAEDRKIESYNGKFQDFYTKLMAARERHNAKRTEYNLLTRRRYTEKQYNDSLAAVERARKAEDKILSDWRAYVEKTLDGLPLGSGRVIPRTFAEFD